MHVKIKLSTGKPHGWEAPLCYLIAFQNYGHYSIKKIPLGSEDTSPKAWISSLQIASSGIGSCDGLNNCQAFSTTSPSFWSYSSVTDRFVHYVSKEEKKVLELAVE